jgi:hypothetical protein
MSSTTPSNITDALELGARQDHLRLLAHAACSELIELVRLHTKLAERGGHLVPLDCFKWIDAIEELETARRRYVRDFKRYDGPKIIFAAAEGFASRKVALVIEGAMESWRERIMKEAAATIDRERAAATPPGEG